VAQDPIVHLAHAVILAGVAVAGTVAMFLMFRRQLER
jgi:hypothetical protein